MTCPFTSCPFILFYFSVLSVSDNSWQDCRQYINFSSSFPGSGRPYP
jgi:hypothetical protein